MVSFYWPVVLAYGVGAPFWPIILMFLFNFTLSSANTDTSSIICISKYINRHFQFLVMPNWQRRTKSWEWLLHTFIIDMIVNNVFYILSCVHIQTRSVSQHDPWCRAWHFRINCKITLLVCFCSWTLQSLTKVLSLGYKFTWSAPQIYL